MTKHLLNWRDLPELIISSTAVRAHTTVQLAIDNAQWKSRLILERGIYGGSPDFLLGLIHSQDNIYNSICLVGHEPNFSSFISKATNKNYINFTTANMAKVNFNVDLWAQVQFFNGELEWHQQPKNLELSH